MSNLQRVTVKVSILVDVDEVREGYEEIGHPISDEEIGDYLVDEVADILVDAVSSHGHLPAWRLFGVEA